MNGKTPAAFLATKNADRTYIITSKENVHRNMQKNWRTFPFEELMYGKTPPTFETNIKTSKDMACR